MALDEVKKFINALPPVKKHRDASKAHAAWYDEALPEALSAKHPELGLARVVGTPRDTAAEYAGAADWVQRSPYPKPVDAGLALMYQFLNHGLTKNARDNMVQDISAIWNTSKDQKLSQDQLIEIATKYAKDHDFGVAPTDILPVDKDEVDPTQVYYQGGLVLAKPRTK